MTDYGVQPTGFVRKPLAIILAEIEALNITEFGPGVIQTSESPLGQINGVAAEAIAKEWELAEDIYQSYDPDQAEGFRLEALGRIRLVDRASGETDESYRRGITNSGAARIDLQDISRAIAAIDGVTYSHVFINDMGEIDANGMPAGSICVAISGGDDGEIAAAVRSYIAPGIVVYGNTSVDSVIDGYCRTLRILRPIEVPFDLTISVRTFKDRFGCPAPSATAIRTGFISGLYLLNGDDIDNYRVRSVIENQFSNVEVISINGERDDIEQVDDQPVSIGFIERGVLNNLTIVVV